MAKLDPQAIADRLWTTFLAPLVLGGTLRPGKPFGGLRALAIGDGRQPTDHPTLSRAELARVRVARKLAPVDIFDPAPTGSEWAVAAALHDLVQATNPGFDAAFRRSGPKRLLDVIDQTLDRVPRPATPGEALSRHTWFSRMFELARTDVEVRWWTGSETFLGTDPPARLLAWPEMRRVQQIRTPRNLMDLPTSGAAIDASRFAFTIDQLLAQTPLTDIATLDRSAPAFMWTQSNLVFCSSPAGKTMALRALARIADRKVDSVLGRATKVLFAAKKPRALMVAVDMLRDRALAAASSRLGSGRDPEPLTLSAEQSDASFAVSAGAIVATQWIAQTGGGFTEAERRALLQILAPATNSSAASEVRALLPG